eukprot:COSAG01_NODE_12288_length_1765_cov_11.675429_1_plen_62_part_10
MVTSFGGTHLHSDRAASPFACWQKVQLGAQVIRNDCTEDGAFARILPTNHTNVWPVVRVKPE